MVAVGALCSQGSVPTLLAATHKRHTPSQSYHHQKCPQPLLNVPWGTKQLLLLKIIVLDICILFAWG